jgi:hypothetical protein
MTNMPTKTHPSAKKNIPVTRVAKSPSPQLQSAKTAFAPLLRPPLPALAFEKAKPLRSIVPGLCFVAALMLATRCLAHGVGNFCPFGPCVPSQETIINLYWDSSVSQWDTHVGGAASGLTVGQLDAFTTALVHSTYFFQLHQYHVNQILMGPTLTAGDCSATPSAATQPANVDAAINGGIDALIGCIAQTNPTLKTVNAAIINVFLPPQVIDVKGTGFCSPKPDKTHAAAMHNGSSVSNRFSWTIIPTTGVCNSGFGAVTSSLSHEMVEAATDPNPAAPSGWKVVLLGAYGGDEIADMCAGILTPTTPFLGGAAALYWSNSDNACVQGFATTTAPSISNASVCGTGGSMQITLRGSFGPPPWDLTSNNGRTLYMRARVNPADTIRLWWNAGSPLGAPLNPVEPPERVGFAKVTWTQATGPGGVDEIKISGFDASYGVSGRFVRPGDKITITVVNPDNGALASTTVTSPDVTTVHYFGVAPDLVAGAMSGISGVALDSAGCPVETTIHATGGTVSSAISGPDGWFSADFTAPEIAGPVTINLINLEGIVIASGTTRVHPRLDSLVQPRGGVSGSQTTVLNGMGFDTTATQVTFGGSAAAVKSAAPDHKSVTLTTPKSPLTSPGAGAVSVLATVHGVVSSPIQYDYVDTSAPVIEFVDAAGMPLASKTCDIGHIRVQVFNLDGTPRTGSVLLSAGYPAFWMPTALGRVGRWVTSITAGLGDVVTLSGGGPVTAVDAANPGSKGTTESFPVWSPDLCDLVKPVDKKLSQIIWANNAKLYVSSSKCEGDCGGAGPAIMLWADAEDLAKARNYVSVSGKSAEEIKASYKVEAVSKDTRNKLISENPFVAIHAKAQGPAVFVGPMINIETQKAATTEAGHVAGGRISFALPLAGSGAYGIVCLRDVGGRHAWVEDVIPTRQATKIEADVTSDGIYSLVRIGEMGSRLNF